MKKIVPFNNVLEFNTDVKEITAISLEHEINKYPDMISGVFYISGDYKIAEGLLEKEKFNFELPFDIALSNNYRTDSLLVDIDDFRYELISDKNLKVNIDLYIDGEMDDDSISDELENESLDLLDREIPEDSVTITEELLLTDEQEEEIQLEEEQELYDEENDEVQKEMVARPEKIDLLSEMLEDNKEEELVDTNISINNENEVENKNINFFEPNQDERFVTYRVYKVMETDTIDTILAKYNVTKEMLADYNNVENINPGDKLIIPTNEK